MMDKRFICSECGEEHPFENIELSFHRPDAIAEIPADERTPERCQESNDLCALWGSAESEHRYFVRGVIPFAVREQRREYSIGAWAEVDRYSFDRILELWSDSAQSEEPALSGLFANAVPFHESTLGLPVDVQLTGPQTRPRFVLRRSTHLLYLEQTHGISAHQAAQYTSLVV